MLNLIMEKGGGLGRMRSSYGQQWGVSMWTFPQKKVRRRMGMWGFGERERLNRCEGQFGGGRNLKKGVSEVERQKDGNDSRIDEGPEFDGCKVTEKIQEIPNMAANNTDRRASKVIADSKWDLASQPGMSPPIPDICTPSPPTPMDSAPKEEEPTQPKMEGHCTVAGQPVLLGKTVTGATKTTPSALHTKKTVRSDPGPPMAEQGAAVSPAMRDGGRGAGNPCAVQEEDFDLSITPLEKEPGGQGRQAGPREVWGHPSSEQRVSPGPTPLEDETAGGLGGGDGCASPQGTPALDHNLFGVIQAPDEAEGHGAAVGMGAAWSEPQSLGTASESLEHVGLGLPQDLAMLRASDQPDVNPNQHLHGEDDALENRDTGSEYGGPGHTEYISVFHPVCEDSTLPLETELEQKFSAQYVSVSGCMSRPSTVQSPKPREEPDFDPDSVSDSQLNNITLSEMEDLPAPDSAEGDQQEDASELVCGLIKELSSLNRTVMAAHRELENLRRSNKTSKLPLRRPYGSRRNEV
ncbi:hypothetical protein AGOR_G00197880 [Albula goreensis]|uniref:Uncharacterized protein n=1 Tax=Albula goreensis TaxID=1534307 RepID=A0A8T3CNB7_9TELE|nr:hypothetical protein AGOR_G00197880 [Albula goreensis]